MDNHDLKIRFETIIKNLSLGIIIEDENRRVILVNETFLQMFAIPIPAEQMIGFDCSNAAEQSKLLFCDQDAFVLQIQTILANRVKVSKEVLRLVDGRVLYRDYVPVFKGDSYLGHMWSYLDVTNEYQQQIKLEEQNQKLLDIVDRDYLTNCFSRRYFFNHWVGLDFDVIHQVGVFMIDVDDFKLINDRHGHDFGDLALVEIVKTIKKVCVRGEVLARYGGEEFCLLQVNSSEELLVKVGQIILENIREKGFKVSIGAVLIKNNNKEPLKNQIDNILKKADDNLYVAKQNGKNQLNWSVL